MIRAASAAVSVERVGTAQTLPERRSRCTCAWSKPRAVLQFLWSARHFTCLQGKQACPVDSLDYGGEQNHSIEPSSRISAINEVKRIEQEGPAASRPRASRPSERGGEGSVASRGGPRGPPWCLGRPRRTAPRRRRRASAPASRRAGGRAPPSCDGQSVRRGACRGTPAVCVSANPPRRARTGGPPHLDSLSNYYHQ